MQLFEYILKFGERLILWKKREGLFSLFDRDPDKPFPNFIASRSGDGEID